MDSPGHEAGGRLSRTRFPWWLNAFAGLAISLSMAFVVFGGIYSSANGGNFIFSWAFAVLTAGFILVLAIPLVLSVEAVLARKPRTSRMVMGVYALLIVVVFAAFRIGRALYDAGERGVAPYGFFSWESPILLVIAAAGAIAWFARTSRRRESATLVVAGLLAVATIAVVIVA